MSKALAVFLAASQLGLACPKECIPWEGVCACNAPGFVLLQPGDESYLSDEKPPADRMPSYERDGINADMPSPCSALRPCSDQEIIDANAEGKKAAGIK